MTDNEIIKALECCSKPRKCGECPYLQECSNGKTFGLETDALDLINRQKAENERLTEENKKVSAYIGSGWGYVSFLEFVKNQRAEAIKKFAERLHNLIHSDWDKIHKQIDNLVKEMVGDAK